LFRKILRKDLKRDLVALDTQKCGRRCGRTKIELHSHWGYYTFIKYCKYILFSKLISWIL